VIQIVAFRAAILGFENIGVVEFRRKLDFAREFRYWVIRRITLFVLSITLVFALRNYFALAITMPLSATVTVAISYYMSSYRPVFCFKKFKEIWSFPFWILCANYMDYISNRADEIIIGGASSTTMMGHYHIASDLAMLPTREVVLPMTRALAPTYSKISHDRDELAKAFNGIFNVITIICASVALGLFVVAEDVVVVLLGEQWVASIPFFKWLALYGGLEGLVLTTGSFFIIINKQKLFASLNIGRVVVLLPALIAASYLADIETIAMTRAGIMLLFVLVVYFTIVQISNISFVI
jgi:lipopolysaccharide exporter